ncbi:MAG: DNA repair exonuclease [Dehalococcoidia bacterium]
MAEPRALRVVHTSDVHLGAYGGRSDGHWDERRSLIEQAFIRVIDLALEQAADALLICGDFFDNDRVDDEVVAFAGEHLRRYAGPVYLLPGNHDPLDDGRLYHRHDLESAAPNLRILRAHKGETIEAEGLDLVLWGRGYYDHDWHFRPLEGLPPRLDARWHIALGHGHFVPEGGENHRSLPIHESELVAAAGQWDYIALGHWEPHADVSSGGATAIYSGAPMPLSDSNNRAGWAVVVDFDASGVRWQKHRVDPRHAGAEG